MGPLAVETSQTRGSYELSTEVVTDKMDDRDSEARPTIVFIQDNKGDVLRFMLASHSGQLRWLFVIRIENEWTLTWPRRSLQTQATTEF